MLQALAEDAARLAEPPDARLGEFQAVAGRIAEVDRAAAARPFEIGLDGNALGDEPRRPAVELGGGGAEAEVAGARRAVRGHRQRTGCWRNARGLRIEDQQHLPA